MRTLFGPDPAVFRDDSPSARNLASNAVQARAFAGVPCPWPDVDISSHEAATCGCPFRPGEGEEGGEG